MSEARAFQAGDMARAKALRQDHTWDVSDEYDWNGRSKAGMTVGEEVTGQIHQSLPQYQHTVSAQ